MNRQSTRIGEEFSVPLPAVPPTGYLWELQSGGENVEVVRKETTNTAKGIGGAAAQQMVLRPKKTGSFVLKFGLKRPWETESVETLTVEVNVTDDGGKEGEPPAGQVSQPTK